MKNILLLALLALSSCVSAQDSLKVSFLGDSYTTFEGYCSPSTNHIWYHKGGHCAENDVKSVEETWWYQVVDSLGAKLEINNSFSGSTISCLGYRGEDFSDRAFITRMYNLGKPDLILVCGGTNDSWAGVPVGEYRYEGATKKDFYTFRPAMAYLLRQMKMFYPQSRIIFILNSELRPEINESVLTICEHYDVECLCLKDIEKGYGHPSVAGMKAFAGQVLRQIRGQKSE